MTQGRACACDCREMILGQRIENTVRVWHWRETLAHRAVLLRSIAAGNADMVTANTATVDRCSLPAN